MDTIISNSNILNTTAKDGQGGFAVLSKGRWFNISSNIITNSWAPEGRIIVVDSQSYKTNVSISLSFM
jgi:hypothetical protein